MKKVLMYRLAGLFVFATVGSLSACGGGGDGSNGDSARTNGPAAPGPITILPPPSPTPPSPTPPPSAEVAEALSRATAVLSTFRTYLSSAYSQPTFTTQGIGPIALDSAPASSVPNNPGINWSDSALWVGQPPGAGSDVVIPVNTHVILDTSPPALGTLTINGTLEFAPGVRELTAANITVSSTGALKVGEPGAPFNGKATFTLTGARPSIPADHVIPNTRGITVFGKLELYGASPSPVWTQLNANAAQGTQIMTLKQPVDWQNGASVAVGPSDFYGVNPTEQLTLANSAAGNVITTQVALGKFRWGQLQYMTDAGLSLTPGGTYTPPKANSPRVLDERAAVANLSRNIVIQGKDDAAWQTEGFGAHVMVMGLASRVFVDGVQFQRVGQAGAMARYPFHWHMLSYDQNTGAFLGTATGQEIRNSVITGSAQRCIVIHGTNGVKVRNNICHDIRGHAIFLEDGVERDNLIEGNLVLKVRRPENRHLLLEHEGDVYQAGSSGFWITNPDNIIRNNVVADAVGTAYWNSFPTTGVGLSRLAKNPDLVGTQWQNDQMRPRNMPHGVFDNNVGYSTGQVGINTDFMLSGGGPVGGGDSNDRGETSPDMYLPTVDGRKQDINGQYDTSNTGKNCDADPHPDTCKSINMRAAFSRSTIYKTNGGYRNRVGAPDYVEWVMSDVTGAYAAGAGNDGEFSRGLFIGKSLNHNSATYPTDAEPQVMFATYHSTFQMRDNVMAHIGYQEDSDPEKTSSGVFKSDDYYISMMERGTLLNDNNKFIDAFAGSRHYPANLYSKVASKPSDRENFTLAGAIWDPHGYWGPKGFYWTYDVPFLTAGGNCQPSLFPTQDGKNSAGKYNGQSCAGEYFGFTHQHFTDFLNAKNSAGQDNVDLWPVDIERMDCNAAAFNTASIGKPSRACRWVVGSGYDSWKLGNFRGASLRNGGTFKVMFPDPENRPGTGSYGSPVFPARKQGTMVNAEGQTVNISIPKIVNLQFTNMARTSDSIVVGVSFDGAKTPAAVLARTGNAQEYRWLLPPNARPNDFGPEQRRRARVLTLANSLQEVRNSASGALMWQDKPNNIVWFKVVGDFPLVDWYRIENFTAPFAQNIYQEISLYMRDASVASQ